MKHERERHGSVVAKHICFTRQSSEFKTRTRQGYVWCKNLALNIGDCVSLVTWMIMLMLVPFHLIGDVKEPLRTTCTLAATTLNVSI